MAKTWSTKESASLYNLRGWGINYFGINDKGNMTFHPGRSRKKVIDIKTIVDDVTRRGVKLPVLVRFQDILRDRVKVLNNAFKKAIADHNYKGRYYGVFPIKVNQLREVVEEVLDAGEPFQIGLEAGSKPELMAVLAMNSPESLIVVNGYKDETMLRLACLGTKIGKQVIVVIEKASELEPLIAAAKEYGVRPMIGIRAKLTTEGSGRWKSSAGHAAKFGLTTADVISAIKTLESHNMTDCVKLVHFHIGSQVTEIQTIKNAVKEGARIYAKLKRICPSLEYLDCGGGLGVDYEGTNSTSDHSVNYGMGEYTRDVVYSIQEICSAEKVAEPHIVTESGRALTAHHSMLVVNIFGSIEAGANPGGVDTSEREGENRVVLEMRDIIRLLTVDNLAESLHDGQQRLEEAHSLFRLGYLGLEDKARVETLYWQLGVEILKLLPKAERITKEVEDMVKSLEDQYLVNFSVFQSLPDAWALGHIFPIAPLHRLDEEPVRTATLADITCDSDGKLSSFVCGKKNRPTIPLHRLNGKPYYLGIFLQGAYQATMGDIHNLFGRVNEVHVFEDDGEPGGYYIEEVIHGQTVRDVLESIQYSEFELIRMVKGAIDVQVKAGKLKPREGVDLLDEYEDVMKEYTYIEHGTQGAEAATPAPADAFRTNEAGDTVSSS
jgi:arginine decarboxylase